MEYFTNSKLSQSRSDLLTPVGRLIDDATSETLVTPDWSLNLAVCDAVNSDDEFAGEQAMRAFRRKLREANPKVLQLTLTLLETVIKNADQPGRESRFHALVGSPDFLAKISSLTDGKRGWEVKEQALALLQQWGLSFESRRDTLAFYSTYMDLRLQGVQFPRLEASSPIFTPPAQPSPATLPASTTPTSEGVVNAETTEIDKGVPASLPSAAPRARTADRDLTKLQQDLGEVRERARACFAMLSHSEGIESGDEALAEAVGFLEACKERLTEVIEAGMGGGEESITLTEAVLELALEVHEEVVEVLGAERSHAELQGGEGKGENEGAKRKGRAETGRTDDLLDFDHHPPPAPMPRPIPTHPDLTATGGENEGHGGDGARVTQSSDPLDIFEEPPAARVCALGDAQSLSPAALNALELDDDRDPPVK